MTLYFKDGFSVDFIKEGNKNKIIYHDFDCIETGAFKDIPKDFGNYWYKKMKSYSDNNRDGKKIINCFILDLYAYYGDFDCYSDFHKDIYHFRPRFANVNKWKEIVQNAKERKP